MAVKSLKAGGLVVCFLLTLFSKVSLSNADKYKLRNGETGRYMYYSDILELGMYCRYCPSIPMLFESEDVNRKYIVGKCVEKNEPLIDKLDQDELRNKLYPVCNEGEIPSCSIPQNPLGGSWKCEESENPDKVLVYKTCQLQCYAGYNKVGEGNIYCNESRKFDPPWTETTCSNAYEHASTGFPFLAFWASVAVVVLVCALVTTVYCCRKYSEQCQKAISRMKRGFKKPKSTVVSSNISESIVIVEIADNVQSTSSENDTQEDKTETFPDVSSEPLLSQEPSRIRNKMDPTENDDRLSYTFGSYDTIECIRSNIEINKADLLAHSDSETFPDTSNYGSMTLKPVSNYNLSNMCRPRPEGRSLPTIGPNVLATSQGFATETHQREKGDSQETFLKEFIRDPKFCDTRAHRNLILGWMKRGENAYCEDIVRVVEEMEGLGSGHRSNQDGRRDYVYTVMREKDIRIGEIVYYVSLNRRRDFANILHQIQKIHPDCNFCKSLYCDITLH